MNIEKEHTDVDELIIGYLSNELSSSQCLKLQEWLDEDVEHKQYMYEVTEVWLSSEAVWDGLERKESAFRRFKEKVKKKTIVRKFSIRLLKIGAAVLLILTSLRLGVYFESNSFERKTNQLSQAIEVPYGSRTRLILNDGTIAWINSGSKLTYSSSFVSKKKRSVYLEGEAYFEVVSDKEWPFIVKTNFGEIEVLGTKFSVKDYAEDDLLEVVLAEGAVNLVLKDSEDSPISVKPNQQIVLNKLSGEVRINKVPKAMANQWTTGAHFFNEISLVQIAKILEKSFDVVIVFRNEAKKELVFYSDFRSDNSLGDILEILSSSNKFKYLRSGDLIEIF